MLTMSRQSSVIIMTQMRFCKLYTCTPRHRTLLPTSPPFTRLLPSNSRVPQKWSQSSFPPTSASWTCPSSWTPRHTPPTLPWSSQGTSWGFPTSQGAIQSKWHDFKWLERQVTYAQVIERQATDEEKCQMRKSVKFVFTEQYYLSLVHLSLVHQVTCLLTLLVVSAI